MTKPNKGFVSLYISLLTLILIFNGCEDPGSVGNSYIDEPTTVIDTLFLDNIAVENFQGYSGNLQSISIGKYSDQMFGDIQTTGLVRPIRNPNIPDSLNIEGNNFSLKLEIQLDSVNTYGDTLSVSEFSIYEITSLWRGNSYRLDSELTYDEGTEIGSFTIGQEKNIIVDLSDSWKDKYATYLNSDEANIDSLYQYEFHGLAIVPTGNTNKISFPNTSNSRFLILNEGMTDTAAVRLRNWAYNSERTNVPQNAVKTSLHSTIEEMMKIDIPFSQIRDKHQTSNILKAELVLYEDSIGLAQTLPTSHYRPDVNFINIDLATTSQKEFQYQLSEHAFFGFKSQDAPYYKANVTNYLNNLLFGQENNSEILIGLGSTSGILRSTSLYNQSASQQLRPKLIITTIVNEEN
ncbi:MAG: hypothetical protein HUJ22_11710 [Gracilimonas sp.]|uniref:hypothetical protein n=1 Tax=Gracilimonas sp. TaxID=1974203 RepID=UPI00198BCD59|nr:hypothetical protein [Gracilimonas sp.]MBD3617226.1 hypothetical protein [Gracilimonas sp.]